MRDVNGQTVAVLDYSHKRRSDCEIEDEKLRQACMVRIHDRLVPEIRKAFQFNATRMERYIVACYSSDTADHFRPHRDNTTKGTAHRRFAVSLVLNAESFEGGFLRFPEFGRQLYAPPSGGAVVFSCSLLHEATLVTRGTRFVFLPFLYDDAAAAIRQQNLQYIAASDIDPNDTANSRPRSRTMESIELFVVAFMVFVNAIFAAYEIALASVTVARLQFLSDHRRPGAAAALYMKTEIEKSLAVVQLGITLVGLVAGAAGGASASDDIAPMLQRFGLSAAVANVAAIVLVVLPLTAVTIIGGELVPKLFALRNKEWVCLRLSPMMKMFATSVWPVVWALEAAASGLMDLSEKLWIPKPHADARTESVELLELRAIASLARTSRLIGAREENIILGAARLASRPLREIVLPAEHIRMLNADAGLADSLVVAHLDLHTRFPVADQRGDPQSIVGYVTFKDMVSMLKLSPDIPSLRGILRQIPSLLEEMPIAEAMERLLREHTHIALVRNSSGIVKGMITLEDIVEEMIGDIQDEHDLLPTHCVRSGNGWVVGGGISLPRLKELTSFELTSDTMPHNLSAWILERLATTAEGGEVVNADAVTVLVRKVRRQRVLEAAIRSSNRPASNVPDSEGKDS